MTEAEASQAALNALQDTQNDLAEIFFDGLGRHSKQLVRDGEGIGAAMGRITSSVQLAGPLLSSLGRDIELLGLAGAEAATRFVDHLGGLENAGNSVAAYMNAFFDAGERADVMQSQLEAAGIFAKTMDGYRAQIDSAFDNGNEARAGRLISFAPAFAEWATLRNEVVATAQAERDELPATAQARRDAAQAEAQAARDANLATSQTSGWAFSAKSGNFWAMRAHCGLTNYPA